MVKTTFVLSAQTWSSFSIAVLAKGSIFLKLLEPEPEDKSWHLLLSPPPLPAGSPVRVRTLAALTKAPLLSLLNSSGPSAMLRLCFSAGLWSLISIVHSTLGSQRMCLFIYFYYYCFTTTPVIVLTAIEHVKRVASTRINSRPQIVLEDKHI